MAPRDHNWSFRHRDTSQTGQPITWSEGTDDEMCLAFLYVSPY